MCLVAHVLVCPALDRYVCSLCARAYLQRGDGGALLRELGLDGLHHLLGELLPLLDDLKGGEPGQDVADLARGVVVKGIGVDPLVPAG